MGAADAARNANITLFAVGIGKIGSFAIEEINGIANDPDNQFAFFVDSQEDINVTANNMLDVICTSL